MPCWVQNVQMFAYSLKTEQIQLLRGKTKSYPLQHSFKVGKTRMSSEGALPYHSHLYCVLTDRQWPFMGSSSPFL